MDQINVELIKCSYADAIADIYNNIATTRKYPNEMSFKSTTKVRKTEDTNIKSSTNNFLLVLRKILAVCIMKRINLRLDSLTPFAKVADI